MVCRTTRCMAGGRLQGFKQMSRLPEGLVWGPTSCLCQGLVLAFSRGSCLALFLLQPSSSRPLCAHPHRFHSLLLSLLFGLSLRLWTTVSWLTLDLACAPQVPAAIADFCLNHRSIVKPFFFFY